jgi:multimeric flavodoxin WrbA
MTIKMLGVCGSPVSGGNTEVFLAKALEAAASNPDVTTNLIALADKDVSDCRHCNWCLTKQVEGRFCVQEDQMSSLYPDVLEADAIVFASPVYIGRLSGYLAAFMDRLRVFIHGNLYRGRLVDRVGGAMAVSWYRHVGLETTLQSIVVGILGYQMVPVGTMACPWGAPAVASQGGTGRFDKNRRHGVLDDQYGLKAADDLAARMVVLARKLKPAGNTG